MMDHHNNLIKLSPFLLLSIRILSTLFILYPLISPLKTFYLIYRKEVKFVKLSASPIAHNAIYSRYSRNWREGLLLVTHSWQPLLHKDHVARGINAVEEKEAWLLCSTTMPLDR